MNLCIQLTKDTISLFQGSLKSFYTVDNRPFSLVPGDINDLVSRHAALRTPDDNI